MGYADSHTITFGEKICTIVYLLHNLVVGAYVLGYINNWISPGMGREEEYKACRARASRFYERNNISRELCDKMFTHFRLEYATN